MIRTIALAVSAALFLLAGALWVVSRQDASDDPFQACRPSSIAGDATIGGPFELVNSSGETVTDKDVITRPSLIYFGYTFCPDICPMDAARNAAAVELLESRGRMVTPVFISIDPQRDTPEVVGDFAANLHERAIGLTGSEAQIEAARRAYRTYFNKPPAEDDDPYYLIDHSTFSYLVFPEQGFVEFFNNKLSTEDLADRVQCFVDAVS